MKRKLIFLSLWTLPGIVSMVLYQLAFSASDFVEAVYSRAVYPFLTKIFAPIYSLFSFSVAEFLLYGLFAAVLFFLGYLLRALFRPQGAKLFSFLRRLLCLLIAASTFVTCFVFGWGLNYARNTVAQSMGLSVQRSTVAELTNVCESLAARANTLRQDVKEDETGCFTLSTTVEDVFSQVPALYDAHAEDFMNLCAKTDIKSPFGSKLLSYTETTGIFSPFTYECHVNTDMPDLFLPVTAAHEYAHLQGFAREDEANFIGWYVSRNAENADFAYSAVTLALMQALNKLAVEDYDAFVRIRTSLCVGIDRDWAQHSAYWEPYETAFSEKTSQVYHSYLQANGITDGVKSYGRMLDLILAMNHTGMPI